MRLIKHTPPPECSKHRAYCTPMALAALLQQPYQVVNAWLQRRGYRQDDYARTRASRIAWDELGFVQYKAPAPFTTVNQLWKLVQHSDVLYIEVRHHSLGIRDGIVRDTRNSMKAKVTKVYIRTRQVLPWDWCYAVTQAIPPKKKRGEKLKQLVALIEAGITEPAKLSRQAKVSYVYARSVILKHTSNQNTQTHANTSSIIHSNTSDRTQVGAL